MSESTQGKWGVGEPEKRDQLKLVYDYIKFHIALYVGTPAALGVLADAFGVKQCDVFRVGLVVVVTACLIAGVSAGRFMSKHVNDPWQAGYLEAFEKQAFTRGRRFLHHGMYWLGLTFGLGCLAVSVLEK